MEITASSLKAEKVYEYIKYLVDKNFEHSDNEILREYERVHFEGISLQSVEDIMKKCVDAHRDTLKLTTPVGIAIDRWSDDQNMYFAVFSISNDGKNNHRFYLGTALSQIGETQEECKVDFEDVLYECNLANHEVEYIVCASGFENRRLTQDLDIPSITCCSQKLNSAINKYLGLDHFDSNIDEKTLNADQLERFRILTVLNRFRIGSQFARHNAKLFEYMNFQIKLPYASRWEEQFRLCTHFCMFKNDLIAISKQDTPTGRHVASILPSLKDIEKIESLKEQLSKFYIAHEYLTSPENALNLANVRILFDKIIHDFGANFSKDLSREACINASFESAIMQILTNSSSISEQERQLVRQWEIPTFQPTSPNLHNLDNENMEAFCQDIIDKFYPKKQHTHSIEYKDLSKLPITSNYLDYLVPFPKYNRTQESAMSFELYDAIYYFKFNAKVFDVNFIQSVIDSE